MLVPELKEGFLDRGRVVLINCFVVQFFVAERPILARPNFWTSLKENLEQAISSSIAVNSVSGARLS